MLKLFATFGARGTSALGGVVLSIIVARLSGADGLGLLTVFISLLAALSILSRRGQDSLLMRSVATRKSPTGMGVFLLLTSGKRIWPTIAVAILLGIGLTAFGLPGPTLEGAEVLLPVGIVLLTILALCSGYMRGMERPYLAPALEIGGVSLVAAMLLYGVTALFPNVDPLASIGPIFIAAMLGLLALAAVLVRRDLPHGFKTADFAGTDTKEMVKGEWDFTLIALTGFLFQAGSFLLAAPFLEVSEIGLVRGAERLALLVSFPLLVVTPIVAPRLAQAARASDKPRLIFTMKQGTITAAAIGLPIAVLLFARPDIALRIMGPEFSSGEGYLRTMVVAQAFALVTGLFTTLLNMSGQERMTAKINVSVLCFAIVIIPVLSHLYASTGFVLAYCITLALKGVGAVATALHMSRQGKLEWKV